MNSDGCYKSDRYLAGAGGVLQDHFGHWICGYSVRLGTCSIVSAELWALIHGLQLAWEREVRLLMIEIDSLFAYH